MQNLAKSVSTSFRRTIETTSKSLPKRNTTLVIGSVSIATASVLTYYNFFNASEDTAHIPQYPWSHNGFDQAFDARSIRRGYQVYRNVCSTCHGMQRTAMRILVDVAYTKDEAKALAEELRVVDKIPDDQGNEVVRAGTLADYFVSPFKNEKEARFSNGGALPPDLSLIVKARDHGEDYVFSLLTGYSEKPHGLELRQGLYYNPYFPGGAIGMAPPLMDGQMDFEDGTPATVSQMAKDVSTYLAYTAQQEFDERKKMGIKILIGLVAMTAIVYYHKRFRWQLIKTRRIKFDE